MTDARWPYLPDEVSAPGDSLREILDERGITQKGLAARIGRPLKTVNEIVKGKAQITPDTAVQLERALGLPAAFWNEREAHYRGYLARVEADKKASAWVDWLAELPVKEMIHAKALPKFRATGANKKTLLIEALKFFGVASPDEWHEIYARPQAAYRRTREEQSHRGAIAAWLRLGELEIERCDCAAFDPQKFREALDAIKPLTLESPAKWQPEMIRLCADAGVALAFVPAIPRAHVSGAARWINRRAVVQLSLYGKMNDRFWFTFFHEAAHILLHGRGEVFLDDLGTGMKQNEFEEQANRFAAEFLIPPKFEPTLKTLVTDVAIKQFAEQLRIHPGIVLGRLQHDEVIPYRTPLNYLKARFCWVEASTSSEQKS